MRKLALTPDSTNTCVAFILVQTNKDLISDSRTLALTPRWLKHTRISWTQCLVSFFLISYKRLKPILNDRKGETYLLMRPHPSVRKPASTMAKIQRTMVPRTMTMTIPAMRKRTSMETRVSISARTRTRREKMVGIRTR